MKFKEFKISVENQLNMKINEIKTTKGRRIMNIKTMYSNLNFLINNDIKHKFPYPYTHEQVEIEERNT